MLQLKNITKEYVTGDSKVSALNGVSLAFRKNEFVSILGPSGCGKTTLLNIIGGLDRYTTGDLIIGGKSTRSFKDRDWDSYRNHSIGFVFQSYNLIPHQTILSNVELALTLSGVSKRERRQRAKAVLEKVGLGNQLRKKPNQLSGGQMQRVAIARALINDPAILLADEPTGALDSETSMQVMELLKEVAKDRLVIMVTHNPDLAAIYSTRIIRLLDGQIVDDSMPYSSDTAKVPLSAGIAQKKTSMSFFTALSLSFQNLMTKKARTILTAFAGSIGIIGIALILSMSNGATSYIESVERDTLSSYPVQLESSSADFNSILANMMEQNSTSEHELDAVYSNNVMTTMMNSMIQGAANNNLKAFKSFIDSGKSGLESCTSEIRYTYSTPLNIYNANTSNGLIQVNPNTLFETIGFSTGGYTGGGSTVSMSPMQNMDIWRQLTGNEDTLRAQYDVVAGRYPEAYDEVVVIMDENNEVTDFTLYSLGLLDANELKQAMSDAYAGNEVTLNTEQVRFTYDEILSLRFKLLLNSDYFENRDGLWVDQSENQAYLLSKLADATEIKVVGILRPADDATLGSITGAVCYRGDLMQYLIEQVNASEVVKAQQADPSSDIFTGQPFANGTETAAYTADDLHAYIAALPADQQSETNAYVQQMAANGMSEDEIANTLLTSVDISASTYEGNLSILGVSDLDSPSGIEIYPTDFEAKDQIVQIIDDYNKSAAEEDQLTYTDYIGLMMSSITTIINAISYILIAFVAISLVVSSIMIGIITYISVLERTKEIGILRSIGASRLDISNVFNAETITIGFVSGMLGIGITLLLLIPINLVIEHFTGIGGLAALPTMGAIVLVVISMLLTFIAGLIPSRVASRKDPVIALRTE